MVGESLGKWHTAQLGRERLARTMFDDFEARYGKVSVHFASLMPLYVLHDHPGMSKIVVDETAGSQLHVRAAYPIGYKADDIRSHRYI